MRIRLTVSYLGLLALTSCGHGGGGSSSPNPSPSQTYTVGGSVSGLNGTLALQNNGGNTVSVPASGSFAFSTVLTSGGAYNVTVSSQPVGQTCSVASGSGTVQGANVTSVTVTCATNTYAVGGTVSGLTQSGLVIANGLDTVNPLPNATTFVFSNKLPYGAQYSASITGQPSGATCTVANGSGTVPAADVTAIQVTCSGGPSATQGAGKVRLSNGLLALTFDASTGSLSSIVDGASGLELMSVAQGAYHATWGIQLGKSTSPPYADNNSSGAPTITLSSGTASASATFVWTGLNFNFGPRTPGASISVTVTLNDADPLSHWTFAAHSVGGINATALLFPIIGGVGPLGANGSDNRLLLPEQEGRLISDPIKNGTNWGHLYPSSFMTMQFEAYYNGQAGFFSGTRDIAGQTKTINWYPPSSPSGSAIWQTIHYFPDQPSSDLVLPYEAVVGRFQGDWIAAAEIYKQWASGAPWTQQALNKQLPAWFVPSPLQDQLALTTFCAYSCGGPDSTYDDFARAQALDTSYLGLSTLVTLWGWEKLGAWYYGDYFPPEEGWTSFDSMVKGTHQPFIDPNGLVPPTQSRYLKVLISGEFVDGATPLWQAGTLTGSTMQSSSGSPLSVQQTIGSLQHTWYFMNPTAQAWAQLTSSAVQTLASHNVDFLQFDNWPFSEPQDDYSPGHPPGKGGSWQWVAQQALITQAEAAGTATLPTMAFGSEGAHEMILPFITIFDDRDVMAELLPYSNEGVVVPLFSFVYKPHIQASTEYWPSAYSNKPTTYHALALARALTWGQLPQFPNNPWLSDPSLSQPVLAYYGAVETARLIYPNFLINGEMLPPPLLSSPSTPVAVSGDGAVPDYSGSADSIQTSAWRDGAGNYAIVLTNIGPSFAVINVPVDYGRMGMPAGHNYTADLVYFDQKSPKLGTVSGSTTFVVRLGPLEVALLTFHAQ
jgi:hypothetical protein